MLKLQRVLLGLALVVGLLVILPAPARADFCFHPVAGACQYIAITGDPPGAPCLHRTRVVDCVTGIKNEGTGYWSNIFVGYLVELPTSWIWTGDLASGRFGLFLDPKDGPTTGMSEVILPIRAVGPDPRQLANQAIAAMNLRPITIGIVPEPLPDHVGLVGLPAWMWVENPTENTVGPITRTAGIGAASVTATATMTHIVWTMGDGSVVTCATIGTKYEDRYGKSPSPTCGYRYTAQGARTVTATSHWTVAWTGLGQTGTIPLTFTQSVTITIGEIQVITR